MLKDFEKQEEKNSGQFRLTADQKKKLNTRMSKDDIKTIKVGNFEKKYISGAYVKDKLNDVFGADSWTYEYKLSAIHKITATGDKLLVGYQADVELTVWDGHGNSLLRRDIGTGAVKTGDYLEEIKKARKGAITDGIKRCAVGFGSVFGLHIMEDSEE